MGGCRKTTQARMREEDSQALREIAAAFGFYVQRGIGAHKVGNTTTMLECLAERWRTDREGTQRLLAPLLADCAMRRSTTEQDEPSETDG